MCLSICRSKNYEFAGLEWEKECYCGEEPKAFVWAWPDKCNDKCAGDSNQNCGGSSSISLWKVPPKILDGICVYNSPTNLKILSDFRLKGIKKLTVEKCNDICEGKSYIFSNHEFIHSIIATCLICPRITNASCPKNFEIPNV